MKHVIITIIPDADFGDVALEQVATNLREKYLPRIQRGLGDHYKVEVEVMEVTMD